MFGFAGEDKGLVAKGGLSETGKDSCEGRPTLAISDISDGGGESLPVQGRFCGSIDVLWRQSDACYGHK